MTAREMRIAKVIENIATIREERKVLGQLIAQLEYLDFMACLLGKPRDPHLAKNRELFEEQGEQIEKLERRATGMVAN